MTFNYYTNRTDLWHDPKHQSYAITMQGDLSAPNTITALTRNIWSASREERQSYYENHGGRKDGDVWKYPTGDRPWLAHVEYHVNLRSLGGQPLFPPQMFYGPGSAAFSMTGFARGEGIWVTAGGAVAMGPSSQFISALNIAKDTYDDAGAHVPFTGLNLTVLRPAQDGTNPAGGGEFVKGP